MKHGRRDRPPRRPAHHRDRRAVRRRRRHRAVDQPDLDGHLQAAHRASRRAAPIVLSPHPSAARCITRDRRRCMHDAARAAGLPDGAIGWMTTVTLARHAGADGGARGRGHPRHRRTRAWCARPTRAGKPAYGVGPGNAPCYVESSADIAKAADDILAGKTFDNGVLCSSPNSVVVDRAVAPALRAAFVARRRPLPVAGRGRPAGAACSSRPQRLPNPALVGKSATHIAAHVGITVPGRHARAHRRRSRASAATIRCRSRSSVRCSPTTRSATGGKAASAARRSCATAAWATRCRSTRATTPVILEFGLHKPAFRICVNTPTTHGSIGLTTGLDPAMTLGCGGYGGNITSDNITPRHLLNIKRLAYELRPRGRAPRRPQRAATAGGRPAAPPPAAAARAGRRTAPRRLPADAARRRHRPLARRPRRGRPPPARRGRAGHAGHARGRSSARTTCAAPRATAGGCSSARGPSSRRPPATPARRLSVFVWLDGIAALTGAIRGSCRNGSGWRPGVDRAAAAC